MNTVWVTVLTFNKIKTASPYLFLLLIFSSCKKENAFDCFKSTGKRVTQHRDLGAFKTITLRDKINLVLQHGSSYVVEISAGEHLLKNILTTVSGDDLVIENANTCNFVRGYKQKINVTISSPYVDTVFHWGVGRVTIGDNFVQDSLVVHAESSGDVYVNGRFNKLHCSSNGNGDLYLSGNTGQLYTFSLGSNFIDAEQLEVNQDLVVYSGSLGDCAVDATHAKSMDCVITNSGNVYYRGNPSDLELQVKPGVKGKLIKRN